MNNGIHTINHTDHAEKITTALLLAAGTGSRLGSFTDNMPKCLTKINGTEILGKLVDCLRIHNFKRLVIVVGHYELEIRNYLDKFVGDLTVEYIVSSPYRTTNNIYSLWLAQRKIEEPFLLIESDLVFVPSQLEDMLLPGRIAVSHILPWMNGTTVTTDKIVSDQVVAFNIGDHIKINDNTYKTINIYSFSWQSWKQIIKRLDSWISTGKVNDYYEVVFAEMVADGSLDFQCIYFDRSHWYEIDTVEDLHECEKLFLQTEHTLSAAV